MFEQKNLIVIWALVGFFSSLIFFILSRIPKLQVRDKTILNNYFTYYIVFQCAHILLARVLFAGRNNPWDLDSFLFRIIPMILIVLFILKKDIFVRIYFAFSTGSIAFYILNVFEPRMSFKINMYVIVPILIESSLYYIYLRKNFKTQLQNSYNNLKIWALDFDRKQALFHVAPVIAIALLYSMVLIIIVFKFRHVIAARL